MIQLRGLSLTRRRLEPRLPWIKRESRRMVSSSIVDDYRLEFEKEIQLLPEYQARQDLENFLLHPPAPTFLEKKKEYKYEMSGEQVRMALDAALATFHLHVESRIASLCGKGYYTIGPCGEELLSPVGLVVSQDDTMALHYRHLSISLSRQLLQNKSDMSQLLLDRARGYAVSSLDPVCGGVHCALGNPHNPNDYVVTSTLASQCPPAVGRALGFALTNNTTTTTATTTTTTTTTNNNNNSDDKKRVSFVTIGDGSIHNAHFLSSYHLAQHATHRNIKCPVLFGISDNGLSISYKTNDFARYFLSSSNNHNNNIPVYTVDGSDVWHVYDQTMQAYKYTQQHQAPSVLHFTNLTRRFGHAATDRQSAYLSEKEITHMAQSNMLEQTMQQAVAYQHTSWEHLQQRFQQIQLLTKQAFNTAVMEPKNTSRSSMIHRLSPPLTTPIPPTNTSCTTTSLKKTKGDVMRKHMTRVIAETMNKYESVVYMGEDVRHGGYYLVTDQLCHQFPNRIIDFPPDETTLLGAGLGFSQVGLIPIVEIPYAKYLDCGADMFYEMALLHWLSPPPSSDRNGIVIRVQGFDKGVFGGNFHTHNMLSHIPPGVDVICFSNGHDYVRGFRNAILQARNGRIVVLIDCTHLLNLRHLYDKDRLWETSYPNDEDDMMGFHDIRRYGTEGNVAIVTFGNGVVTSLRARKMLFERGDIESESMVDIVDVPLLSEVSHGLKDVLPQYDKVLFADICKMGPGSNILSSTITSLQSEGLLQQKKWEFIAAPRTYNPLGTTLTFLNEDDIIETYRKLLQT